MMPAAKAKLEELVGTQLWADKRSSDKLAVCSVELDGWAVSNVRKGTTKNIWELEAKVWLLGSRGGTELRVCFATPAPLDHEVDPGLEGAALPELVVESTVGSQGVRQKVVDKDGEVVEKVVAEVDSERAMRNSEMLLKLAKRLGAPLIRKKIAETIGMLAIFGHRQGPSPGQEKGDGTD